MFCSSCYLVLASIGSHIPIYVAYRPSAPRTNRPRTFLVQSGACSRNWPLLAYLACYRWMRARHRDQLCMLLHCYHKRYKKCNYGLV
jgi:hypothetical protein